jgi:hypothetical protein
MVAAGSWSDEPIALEVVKDLSRDPGYDSGAYCVARPSFQNVLLGFEKYDHLDPTIGYDVDLTMKTIVRPGILDWYAELWNQCVVVPFEDIDYVPDAGAGLVWSRLGLKSKQQALWSHYNWLRVYVEEAGFMSAAPPLYKAVGKTELLKAKKVLNNDIRIFVPPPIEESLLQGKYCQDTNSRLDGLAAAGRGGYASVGFDVHNGGLYRFGAELEDVVKGGGVLTKGDIEKFDSRMLDYLLEWSKDKRYVLWNKESVSEFRWRCAIEHIYEYALNAYVTLPTGQVIKKKGRLPSGVITTSNDGCDVHEQTIGYHWVRMTDRPLSAMREHVKGKLYSDDHVFGYSAEYSHLADFKERKRSYETFGLTLKEDEDLVSSSLQDMSFLGFTWNSSGDPVPFRRQKFYHSLARPDGPRNVHIGLQRAVSHMENAAFDDELYAISATVAKRYREAGAAFMVDPLTGDQPDCIPSREVLQRRWRAADSRPRRQEELVRYGIEPDPGPHMFLIEGDWYQVEVYTIQQQCCVCMRETFCPTFPWATKSPYSVTLRVTDSRHMYVRLYCRSCYIWVWLRCRPAQYFPFGPLAR